MGIDYLTVQVELVNSQENGLEHNQHALVSVIIVKYLSENIPYFNPHRSVPILIL